MPLYQQSLTTAATINILVLFSLQISFIFSKPSSVRYYKLDCSSTKQNHIKVLTILCGRLVRILYIDLQLPCGYWISVNEADPVKQKIYDLAN